MGDNEFSEIQAVDFALGAFIAAAFAGLNPATGPKQWREFLTRDVNKKIYREEVDTPSDFLTRLASTGKTETVLDGVRSRLPQLPVCYYFRKPGMTNGDPRNFPSRAVTSEDEAKIYTLTMLPLSLDYQIVFASWDKLSLDKMQLAWYSYLVQTNHFTVQYELAGEALEVSAAIDDPKTLVFSDLSIPRTDGRLFAVNSNLTINTVILFGAEVSTATHPTHFTIEGVFGGYSCTDPPDGDCCG